MSYIDVSGKTVEEALAKALTQLQMDRDDVSVRVLERAKSGFLGLGASPAVIRVTYGEEMEEAVTEPVRKEPRRAITTPMTEPEPAKTAEPASPSPLDRYLFDPPAPAETDANREKKEDPAEDIPFDQDLTWPTTTTPAPAIEPTNHTDRDQSDQGRTKDHVDRKPEIYPKGQPGPTTEGHAGHAEPEPAESHEGTMSGPDRSSDTGSAHDAGPKAGEPARKTTAGFDPDEWLAWADRLKANGETVTSTRAVADGLAPSTTTAKRRLHTLRREHPGRF